MFKSSLFPSLYTGSRIALAGAILILLGLAAGCGVGGGSVGPPPPATPSSAIVTVTPANPSINLISQQQFAASINGTPTTAVSWGLSGTGCSGAACGTIDSTGLYTAPWCKPSPATVTVIATSVADPTRWGSTVVTNTVPGPLLAGRYVFLFQGTDAAGLMFTAGAFTADSNGNVTNGVEDIVRLSAVNTNVTFSGTYNIACYHRGTITITDSLARTQTFAFGLESGGNEARFIEMDNTGIRGSGVVAKQGATIQSTADLTGDFAFGLAGSDTAATSLARLGMIGRFHADGAGAISAGMFDRNSGGTNTAAFPFNGVYTVDSTTGRGAATFTPNLPVQPAAVVVGGGTSYVFYVISPTESFWISTSAVMGGSTLKQSGGPFTAASLSATSVFSLTGKNTANQNSDVAIGIATPNGAGSITGGPVDENFDTTLNNYTSLTGSYTVDASGNGRGTAHLDMIPSASRDMTFYLVAPNTAFLLDGTATVNGPSVGVGFLEPQTGGPYSVASMNGEYYLGTLEMATHYVPVQCGVAILDGLGHGTGMGDGSDIFGNYTNVYVLQGSFTMAASGRGSVGTLVFYLVSPARALMFEMDSTQHQPAITYIEH